jgi:hypothetical protein
MDGVRVSVTLETVGPFYLATFPASWLRVRYGARRSLAALQAEAPGAHLALDGPMFNGAGRVTEWTLRDRTTGVDLTGSRRAEGLYLSVAGDRATMARAPLEGAAVVVQTWPPLLEGGRVVATNTGTNAERVWRAAIGVMADGRVCAAVRQADVLTFARDLAAHGVSSAGYTDGGSSTVLWTREAPAWGRQTAGAKVPAWITAEAPSSAPGAPSSGGPGAPLGALAAVLGGALLLWATDDV